MNCPNGHGPMTEGRKFWICEECNYRVERTATSPLTEASQSLLSGLPSPIAIPWGDLFAENNSVLRLYRLCDAAEITVRFLTITALSETRRSLGDNAPLPNDLLQDLQPNIERPTFGRWWSMLQALSRSLSGRFDLVLPELMDFVTSSLMPLLDGKDAHSSLITLRNELHHSGGLPLAATEQFLDEWMPRVQAFLGSLAFLAETQLRFTQEDQSYPLTGPLTPTGPGGTGRVLLHRGDKALELWPLLDYGPGLAGPNATRSGSMPSGPRVFLRADRDRLLFAALGVDPWQGESRESLAGFRALFRLDEQRVLAPAEAPADFEQEIQADADALVGRSDDIRQAKATIKETQSGVLWIGGPGGMGKSFLMAKLAADLGKDPQKICRLVWRFRAGDAARCSRIAFLRYVVGVLSQWKPLQAEDTFSPSNDPIELQAQLTGLLDRAGVLPARDPYSRPPRILLFLDGLDEIERLDPSFAHLPFDLVRPNVVWVCAGRPERTLPALFAGDRCQHVFAGGLPPMESKDIRAMLLEKTGPFKYALLAQDAEKSGEVSNAIVAAIAEQAEGLPLYVRLVISDIVSGHFHFSDVAQKLPPGLSAYYDDLLLRLGIGDLQAILTPLVVTLAWAFSPLDEEALLYLMAERRLLAAGEDGRVLLRQGLESIRSMVRMAPGSDGGFGYEPYHLTFREHIQTDTAGTLKQQNFQAKDQFCRVTIGWEETPAGSPVHRYALQFGPKHLHDAQRWDDLYVLARSEPFLQEQSSVLVRDPDAPLETLRLALQGAMAQDDAAKMGEFVISHARRLRSTMQETPLSALRGGNLQRAWKLADLNETEKKVLWHLLLAWELKEIGHDADRKETLRRTLSQDLPVLSDRWQPWISEVLLYAASPDEPEFMQVSQTFADPDPHFVRTSQHLALAGNIALAMHYVQMVQSVSKKMEALKSVVVAQARSADYDAAYSTVKSFSADCAEDALEAVFDVARFAFQMQNLQEVNRAFQLAEWILNAKADSWKEWYKKLQSGRVHLVRAETGSLFFEEYSSFENLRGSLDFDRAADAVQEISDNKERVKALITIATATSKGEYTDEDIDQTRNTFNLAREAVEATEPHDRLEKSQRLRDIAQAQIKAGLLEDGLETQNAALEVINRMGDLSRDGQAIFPESYITWFKQTLRGQIGIALSQVGHLEEAQRIAHEIDNISLLASTLSRYAVSQAEAGLTSDSQRTFADAVRESCRLPNDRSFQRSDALGEIATAQLKLGDASSARDTFAEAFQNQDDVNHAEMGSLVLAAIIRRYIHMSDLLLAKALALKITGRQRDQMLYEIVDAQVEAGLLIEAEETLSAISERTYKVEYLNVELFGETSLKDQAADVIADSYLVKGELAAAHGIIGQIKDADARDATLNYLAKAYAVEGAFQQAEDVALQVQDNDEKKSIQRDIARARAEWAQPQETRLSSDATTYQDKTYSFSEVQGIEDRLEQSQQFWQLAEQLTVNGQFAEAVQAVNEAICSILQYDNYFEALPFPDSVHQVLVNLAPTRCLPQIMALFQRLVTETPSQIWPDKETESFPKHPNVYVLLLAREIVRAYASIEMFGEAWETIAEMDKQLWHKLADNVCDDIGRYRAAALRDIAKVYISSKNRKAAKETLDAAIECARAISDKSYRVSGLFRIALAQAECRFGKAALETVNLILAEGREAALSSNSFMYDSLDSVDFDDEEFGLTNITRYFAIHSDTISFKSLLVPCAYSIQTAYTICSQLVWLYPKQTDSIVQLIYRISPQIFVQKVQ